MCTWIPPGIPHRYLSAVDQVLADEQIGAQVVWPLADHEGTVRDLVNSTGSVLNHRKYDSFGKITAETNPAVDHLFAYTGQILDEATGLQNHLNRWYDPSVGRWLSEDPSGFAGGEDMNLYRYVGNNPVVLVDRSGLCYTGTGGINLVSSPWVADVYTRAQANTASSSNMDYLRTAPLSAIESFARAEGKAEANAYLQNFQARWNGVTQATQSALAADVQKYNAESKTAYQERMARIDAVNLQQAKLAASIARQNAPDPFLQTAAEITSDLGLVTTYAIPAAAPIFFSLSGTASALNDDWRGATGSFTAAAASFLPTGSSSSYRPTVSVVNSGNTGYNVPSSAVRSITTPYGVEAQSASPAAQRALAEAEGGATLYRTGQLGTSMAGESQYWALQNPLTPGYAGKIGLPINSPDFIMGGTLNPNASIITNQAAPFGLNPGGGIQVITSPGGVQVQWFHMP